MGFEVVIEISKGSKNKYEINHDSGAIWLDRMLFTPMGYPAEYGYAEGTLGEDGDPLDALVLLEEPTFPGCHIMVRTVGAFVMTDESGRDVKLLCVPEKDPRWSHIQAIEDVHSHTKDEITHFFSHYKDLEPGKSVTVEGWQDKVFAEKELDASFVRLAKHAH